eukprot:symbB.v1.2.009160.t1/scaffold578.1/size184707/1
MDQCLKKGADARKSAISLGSLEYSGDLANQLLNFSSKMEHIYKLLQDLQSRKVEDESQYTKHFAIVDDKLQWYDKAEAAAKGLLTGLKPKPKKKAKAKAKQRPEGDGRKEEGAD